MSSVVCDTPSCLELSALTMHGILSCKAQALSVFPWRAVLSEYAEAVKVILLKEHSDNDIFMTMMRNRMEVALVNKLDVEEVTSPL